MVKFVRFSLLAAGVVALAVALPGLPAQAASTPAVTPPPAGSTYTPVAPTRLLDTRTYHQQIAAGTGIGLNIPANLVPANATAVVLNLTGADSTAPTFLSLRPEGVPGISMVSNLNLAAGEVRANLATVELSKDPSFSGITVTAGPAAVDAIVDLEGYYAPGAGAGFTSMAPTRVLDTRHTDHPSPVGPGGTFSLNLSEQVPAGTTAVVFNLTGLDATTGTYVTAFPTGQTQPPLASNVNLTPGAITPNQVTVPVGADRTVNLYNAYGSVDLIVDLAGYYAPNTGQSFYPLSPVRVLDTRDANGNPRIPIPAGGAATLNLSHWVPATATAAVFNLTGTNVTASTFVTAWPLGASMPVASNLNLVPGQTSANLTVVSLGTNQSAELYNLNGNVDVVADLAGYFAPAMAPCTSGCVYGFGQNTNGELGNGTTGNWVSPVSPVYGLSGVTQTAGRYALRSDGTVWAWGANAGGDLGNGDTGLLNFGYGFTYYYSPVPVQVSGLTGVVAIADHMALKSDGTVWTWGSNYMWDLGNGSTQDNDIATRPVQVSGLTNVTAIAGQIGNGYALKSDGTVWSWGQNLDGELGIGTSGTAATCQGSQGVSPDGPNCASAAPVQVTGLPKITKLGVRVVGAADGSVYRWGPRASGQQDNAPVPFPALSNVTAFANNGYGGANYALLSDGTVRAWGATYDGQLGNSTVPPCPSGACYTDTPVQVTGLTGVTGIAGGNQAGYALRSDGTVWAWGGGQNGALGNGQQFAQSNVPVQVPNVSGVSSIGQNGYLVINTP